MIVDGSQKLAGGSPLPWPVLDCAIQEVDIATGALLWEWHAIDHIALDESLAGTPTTAGSAYDYVHTNAIQLQPDGSLLVSARNTSTVYRIDRPSGAIAWRLGGAPRPRPRAGAAPRRDGQDRRLVRAYARPQPDLVSSQGNVQLLANGNLFVAGGARRTAASSPRMAVSSSMLPFRSQSSRTATSAASGSESRPTAPRSR